MEYNKYSETPMFRVLVWLEFHIVEKMFHAIFQISPLHICVHQAFQPRFAIKVLKYNKYAETPVFHVLVWLEFHIFEMMFHAFFRIVSSHILYVNQACQPPFWK